MTQSPGTPSPDIHLIAPGGWQSRLQSTLDYEAAMKELEPFDHYYTWTLRAALCTYQNRFDDALQFCNRSSENMPDLDGADDETWRRYMFNLAIRFDAQRFIEARNGEHEIAKTDAIAERIAAISDAQGVHTVRLQQKILAFHHVLRRRFGEAYELYEKLIQQARQNPEFGVVSYMGAAAVAHELGYFKEARQHYENGELCMSFSSDRLVTILYSAILKALCGHWGWENEATRWSNTIDVMSPNENTRRCMHERSRLINVNITSGVTATAL